MNSESSCTQIASAFLKTRQRRCAGSAWLPNRDMQQHSVISVLCITGDTMGYLKTRPRRHVGIGWLLNRDTQRHNYILDTYINMVWECT